MSRKRFLTVITSLLALIGIGFAMSPFVLSRNPPSHLPEYAQGVDVTDMSNNSVKVVRLKESRKVESGTSTTWESGDALIIVKVQENKFSLFWVPTWEDKFNMPRKYWGQYEGYCTEYGIKPQSDKMIITCLETDAPDFLYKEWVWSIAGKSLSSVSPNLVKVKFRVQSGVLYAYWANK